MFLPSHFDFRIVLYLNLANTGNYTKWFKLCSTIVSRVGHLTEDYGTDIIKIAINADYNYLLYLFMIIAETFSSQLQPNENSAHSFLISAQKILLPSFENVTFFKLNIFT